MDSGPRNYVRLAVDRGSLQPPPSQRNVPRYGSQRRGGGCCLRCICCCYCSMITLIVILAAAAVSFFVLFRPQIPSYKVNDFSVRKFSVTDRNVSTEFMVTVKAENPNENIALIYGEGSSVIAFYSGNKLGSGQLPNFRQAAKNVTVMDINLKGDSASIPELQGALQGKGQGLKIQIPLLVEVKAPVTVVIGDLPLKRVIVRVNCTLVVDSLSPGQKVGIMSSNYSFSASF